MPPPWKPNTTLRNRIISGSSNEVSCLASGLGLFVIRSACTDSILSMARSFANGHHLHQHAWKTSVLMLVGQTVATFHQRPTRFEDESIT